MAGPENLTAIGWISLGLCVCVVLLWFQDLAERATHTRASRADGSAVTAIAIVVLIWLLGVA